MVVIKKKYINSVLELGIIFFLYMYMFLSQFSFPINTTIFMYAMIGLGLFLLLVKHILYINIPFILMGMMTIISGIGLIYTSNSDMGMREVIIFIVMIIFLGMNEIDIEINKKIKKAIFIGALLSVVGIYLQFILQNSFNLVMMGILKPDGYENLIKAFTVGAYAGFNAYTSDAAFFSAIVFGKNIMPLVGLDKQNNKLIFNIVLAGLALFAVFLTSKRGILVGMSLALLITIILIKKLSVNMFRNVILAITIILGAIIIMYSTNDVAQGFLNRFLVANNGDITSGRIDMYETAIDNFLVGNILIGLGTGATYSLYSAGLHNIYLQLIYDHGILGMIPYTIFFIWNLGRAYIAKNGKSIYIQGLFLVYGLFGNPLFSNIIFMTYLASIAGVNTKYQNIIKERLSR